MDHVIIGRKDFDLIRKILDSAAMVVEAAGELKLTDEQQVEWKTAMATSTPTPKLPETGFKFSKKSLRELEGVDKRLVECTMLALLSFSPVDFMVFDGLRTSEEQEELVRKGMSRTRNSKHLTGHAVDLVPIIGGVPKWDWNGCAQIAFAMDKAATHLGIADKITWGGAWDRTLADFGGDVSAYLREVKAYQDRHAGPDFIDGPHFQIV